MGNDRSHAFLQGITGGSLAGLALSAPHWCPSGPWLMLPALACLWSAARTPLTAGLWGAAAVLVSHRWLLGLHPLTWIGVPAPLSLPLAVSLWMVCGAAAAALVEGWALLARRCRRHRPTTAVLLACLWGFTEVMLSQTPLFWIGVGGSLLPIDPLAAGLGRWVGEGGLAALQLLAGWWLWQLACQPASKRQAWLTAGLVALLLAHGLGWWALRPSQSPTTPSATPSEQPFPPPTLRLGLWQPAMATREKFSLDQQRRLPRRLQQAMQMAAIEGAQGLVAPEGTFPLQGELLDGAPLPLLTGGFRWKQGRQHSALLLVEPGALRPSNGIDKHRLVPLGEWVPSWLGPMSGLSAVGGLNPGERSRLWHWDGPPAAVAICYELSDGAALAEAVREGAQWLLTVANLDPYPKLLQRQFLALSQLRSVETARPLVSAANTGPTGFLSPTGMAMELLPAMQPGLVVGEIAPQQRLTPYVRWGERPMLVVGCVALLLRFKRQEPGSGRRPTPFHRRKTQPPAQE